MRQLFIVLLALVGTGCGQSVILSGSAKLGSGSVTMVGGIGPGLGCSSLSNIVPPTIAPFSGLLGAGAVILDPEPISGGNVSGCFHNPIVRVSDGNTSTALCTAQGTSCAGEANESEFADNSDGEDNNWSSDDSQFTAVNSGNAYHIFNFNTTTMAPAGCFTTAVGSSGWFLNPTYSHVTPKLVYTFSNAAGSAHGTVMKSYSLTGSCPLSPSGTTVYDFSSSVNGVSSSFTFQTDGISCSSDDSVCGTGFSTSGTQNTARMACFYKVGSGVTCLNTSTGNVTGDYGTTGAALCMDCSGTPSIGTFPIHNVKLSLNGQWASIAIGVGCDGGSTCYTPVNTPYFWQVGTTNVYSRCPTSGAFCSGHGVLGNTGYASQYSTPYWGFNLFTSSTVTEFPPAGTYCGTIVTPFDNHPSWWNNTGSDQEPFFTSTTANTNNPTYSFCMSGEVYAVYTPANVSKSGTYLRYAHTFGAATSQFAVQNSIMTVSQTGNFATLTSPMANTSTFIGQLGDTSGGFPCTVQANCRGELFVIKLK